MKVPLLDLQPQFGALSGPIRAQIDEVLDSCSFILGKKVVELEEQLAAYCDSEYALGVSSGTDALLISLMALDVGPGDLVLTTPFSFFATAGCIARVGATPVFIDIDPETYNLAPAALQAWFDQNTEQAGRVKAIIPVHLYGQCADMEEICSIAKRYDIPIIEDAAQAIGSSAQQGDAIRKAGSMGALGCFSFFPSKNLGCAGDGGLVTTSDQTLIEKLRKLRNHGSAPKYYHALIGGNFRLDALQAAVLLAKLPALEGWHRQRRSNAEYYDACLAGIDSVTIPHVRQPSRDCHIYNQYVISVSQREDLRRKLTEAGIGTEVYYPVPFHLQQCFEYLQYQEGNFPVAETACKEVLAIPIYPGIDRSQQDYVVEVIRGAYE